MKLLTMEMPEDMVLAFSDVFADADVVIEGDGPTAENYLAGIRHLLEEQSYLVEEDDEDDIEDDDDDESGDIPDTGEDAPDGDVREGGMPYVSGDLGDR